LIPVLVARGVVCKIIERKWPKSPVGRIGFVHSKFIEIGLLLPAHEAISVMPSPAVKVKTMQNPHSLPLADNMRGAINELLVLNNYYRNNPWPPPFNSTTHQLHHGDARNLSWMGNESVHLVVTSPPYFTLKKYEPNENQLGEISDYDGFLDELDKVWLESARVLVPGGRICCVV
jgi:DNA methylase